ncbi:MAG: YihY/virulence factor BrkB family protein [Arachidicoccus sp.]|nr:YihY/virulence factor BrkB family protein [Arachidicoccus sp.]
MHVPRNEKINFLDVVRLFAYHIKQQGLTIRAGAISFNILIAIPACLLFLFTLIPYLGNSGVMYGEMKNTILSFTPDSGARMLMLKFLDNIFVKTKNGFLSIGFLLALFYSSNAMMGIIRTFDRSVKKRARTNFIKKRLRAIRLTLILFLLFIGTLIISFGQGMLFHHIMHLLHIKNLKVQWLIKNLRWVVIVALYFFSISFIYKYAPTVAKRKKLISLGSGIATFLLIFSTSLFTFWAQNFSNYNKFYGTIGSVLVMMMLLYVNSFMLLMGYELDLSIEELREEDKKEKKLRRESVY